MHIIALVIGALLGLVSHEPRLRRTAHVLRGRPIIYNLDFDNGAIRPREHIRIDSCSFSNYQVIPAIELTEGSSSLSRYTQRVERRISLARQKALTERRPSLP